MAQKKGKRTVDATGQIRVGGQFAGFEKKAAPSVADQKPKLIKDGTSTKPPANPAEKLKKQYAAWASQYTDQFDGVIDESIAERAQENEAAREKLVSRARAMHNVSIGGLEDIFYSYDANVANRQGYIDRGLTAAELGELGGNPEARFAIHSADVRKFREQIDRSLALAEEEHDEALWREGLPADDPNRLGPSSAATLRELEFEKQEHAKGLIAIEDAQYGMRGSRLIRRSDKDN